MQQADTKKKTATSGGALSAERLHALLHDLAVELERGRHETLEVHPDSRLDRDLGIDSLARVQLSLRLERAFGVRLADEALLEAETPADLLAALRAATPESVAETPATVTPAVGGAARAAPADTATLIDVLEYHATRHPDRPSIRCLSGGGKEDTITYAALWDGAQRISAGLRARGLAAGQAVGLMLPTGRDYFEAFFGILLAGCVPVPLYPPLRRAQIEEHLRRQAAILRNAQTPMLIAMPDAGLFAQVIRALVADLRHVVTPRELRRDGSASARPVLGADDVALLQYTSGSTGDPKGVVLTHANLLANIRAIGRVLRATPDDVTVSWLPLYHDMGLIGTWLGSLYHACPFVVMSPLDFITRPERWLWAIHRYRGTLSVGPNFGYDLCVRLVSDRRLEGLDLASWRMAGNGAEAINPLTIRDFCERFGEYGFDPRAMTPMYGLAECSVALSITPLGQGPAIDRIERDALARTGTATSAEPDSESTTEIVCSGIPIPGHEIRIVDDAGRELGERQEGRIEFRGPSATSGYLRNPEKTAELVRDGWLDSGDLGYIAGGGLYVTGRVKDIIVRAGRNLYPEELESAVADIEGVRRGRVAVFPHADPHTGTEGLVVLAETRLLDPADRRRIKDRIRELTVALTDLPPDDIVLAHPGAVLKTPSGKIRRAACSELYRSGRIDRPPPPLWRQAAGLLRASIGPEFRRYRKAAGAFAFAVWFWTVYRLTSPVVWIGAMLLPTVQARRRLLGTAGRAMLRLIGGGPDVRGVEHIPKSGAFIIAANHTSYLDSLALAAVIPPTAAFVAKRELTRERIAGTFLRRLGTAFVERFDPAEGLADTERLIERLRSGEGLVFYPEGTFDRMPGLRAFHMGAFVAAAEAGVPVVPAAIRGTRSILRGDSGFARRARVRIEFYPALAPRGGDWRAAVALKNEVREAILQGCGEPDLVYEPKPV